MPNTKKPLILIDVDGTLLDKQYKVTDPLIGNVIKRMVAKEWQIGLNSDTPICRLEVFANMIGVNGPLVAELGNAIYMPDSDQIAIWERDEARIVFEKFRPQFVARLASELSEVDLTFGDAFHAREAVLRSQGTSDAEWLIVHGKRIYSSGFYAFRTEEQRTVSYDLELLGRARAIALDILRNITDERIYTDINPDQGLCIIHLESSAKRNAVIQLIEGLEESKIFMIGDTVFDWMADDRVIHCAVANAQEGYKERCAFVASSTLTAGVCECLEWIDGQF